MRELIEVYKQSIRQLEQRRDRLTKEKHIYDKRVALLEEEIDELYEAIRMMRPYLEG